MPNSPTYPHGMHISKSRICNQTAVCNHSCHCYTQSSSTQPHPSQLRVTQLQSALLCRQYPKGTHNHAVYVTICLFIDCVCLPLGHMLLKANTAIHCHRASNCMSADFCSIALHFSFQHCEYFSFEIFSLQILYFLFLRQHLTLLLCAFFLLWHKLRGEILCSILLQSFRFQHF